MKKTRIFPVILAAGKPMNAKFRKALPKPSGKTGLQIAVGNCAGLERAIVVLGFEAERLRREAPSAARVVVNRKWRDGQISSLLAGLRKVPRDAAFLLYPVDLVFLTRSVIRRLAEAFQKRARSRKIVMPVFRGRDGHPVIFAPELRKELRRAETAREVVYRDERRIKRVRVNTTTIW